MNRFVETKHLKDDNVTDAKLSATAKKTMCFMYDFSTLGGAVSAITLTDRDGDAQTIPDNAVITDVSIEAVTDNTSDGSATIALGYTSNTTAFMTATAFDNAVWDIDTVTTGPPTAAAGKTDAESSVLATIATAALTAGKWYVWIAYYEGA